MAMINVWLLAAPSVWSERPRQGRKHCVPACKVCDGARFHGDVGGDVSGNVVGDVSGDVGGDVIGTGLDVDADVDVDVDASQDTKC